ncbi:MAG: putative lipid II flippase FtsW [Clostridia bacterium]|nr:putative lipid II flippase FtsW [Clostridia bacterium]
MKLLKTSNKNGDVLIPILAVLIAGFGCLAVYSASKYSAEVLNGDKFFYLKKQVIGLLLGVICIVLVNLFDYKFLNKIKYVLVILSFILLVLVFTPLGVENYGAKRWISLGIATLQPSEIAKFSFAIFVAGYFSGNTKNIKTFKGILPVLLVGGVFCLLIMLEPNMSITVCVGALMLAMLFASGVKWQHLMIITVPIILAVPALIILEPYRLKRLMAFINPWASPKGEGYQLLQSLYALGSGGFFGVGLFNSRQKYRFLPFAESDFILAVIGEEFGFFGLTLLFAVLLFLGARCFKVALKCKTLFGYLTVVGITFIFLVQVAVNALVVTGSIPPTGLPLPLISCGNTSLIVFLSAFGIVYNVSKDCEKI